MGAVAVRDLYLAGKISKTEAEALLCFTNLLGPVYFISHILPIVPDKQQLLCICKEDNAIAVCRKNSIHYPSIPFENAKLQKNQIQCITQSNFNLINYKKTSFCDCKMKFFCF